MVLAHSLTLALARMPSLFLINACPYRDRSIAQSKQSIDSSKQQKRPVVGGPASSLAHATKKVPEAHDLARCNH